MNKLLLLFLGAAATLTAAVPAPSPAVPVAKAPVAPMTNADYELRGFFGAGEGLEVSLGKKGTPGSQWLRVGQKAGGLLVEKADPTTGTAILLTGGVRTTVRLAGEAAPKPTARTYSTAEIRRIAETISKYGETLSEAQQKLIQSELQTRVMQIAMEVQMSGETPNAESMAKPVMEAVAESFAMAAKLPDKNGKITPPPPEIKTLSEIPLESLKSAFEAKEHGEKDAPEPSGDEIP